MFPVIGRTRHQLTGKLNDKFHRKWTDEDCIPLFEKECSPLGMSAVHGQLKNVRNCLKGILSALKWCAIERQSAHGSHAFHTVSNVALTFHCRQFTCASKLNAYILFTCHAHKKKNLNWNESQRQITDLCATQIPNDYDVWSFLCCSNSTVRC